MLVRAKGPGGVPCPDATAGPRSAGSSTGSDHRESAAAPGSPAGRANRYRERVIDATLECLGELGLAATTVDDIARRAGCSRATVYRVFPGGRDAVLAAVVETEAARCMADVAVRMGAATTAQDVVIEGVVGACRWIAGNQALAKIMADEPGVVASWLAFEREGRLLGHAARWAVPFLRRWLAGRDALRVAEWAARLVFVYGLYGPATHDPTDEVWVRHLVGTFVTPGIEMLRGTGDLTPIVPGPAQAARASDQNDQNDQSG